ncbi:unnamed protein product [Triticum turgidum subsp. durum]|uniref:Plant heme peroxidase family profile domain-containing protein n=2 Tax=Triticum TaxID=4564 RepID=A0A9R1PXB0_TRITD|nr:unnamed protein product [Triticum turgidum subsp. durum]
MPSAQHTRRPASPVTDTVRALKSKGVREMAGATFLSAPTLLGPRGLPSVSPPARRHAHIQVCCQAKAGGSEACEEALRLRRRDLIGGCFGATVGLEIAEASTRSTGVAAAADLIERRQRSEFQSSIKSTLTAAIEAKPELVPSLLTLALNDAITYDKATKTGGPNGSIRLSAEISRPENSGLSAALDLLVEAKKEIDSYSKGGPLSFADLIQIAASQALKKTFLDAAIAKTGGNQEKGRTLYSAYGSSGQWGFFDKIFGREDAQEPDPEGRVPQWGSASVQEMKDKFIAVGLGPRQVAVMSAFFGPDQAATEEKLIADPDCRPWVEKYQRSRETVSRTDYEVDLITAVTKLSYLGQKINYEAYTYPKQKINLGKLKL